MLRIKNLHIKVEEKEIINGLDLKIGENEVHALMGPNGSGKSTLAQTLMGHPKYEIISGEIIFNGKNILELDTTERASQGIFLAFQYPSEIPGVSIANFLRLTFNNKMKREGGKELSPAAFRKLLKEKMDILHMNESFMNRYLNEGFSGGEKKRMEILQLLILEPKLAILDETDSGLDIDALKIVAEGVNHLRQNAKLSVLVITHYARVLNYLKPDFVHVVKDGRIVREGGYELAEELEKIGYRD